MKNIFIHIGLPKTGSTYIQKCIHIYNEDLRNSGIYVPKTGTHPTVSHEGHHLLPISLVPGRWDQFPFWEPEVNAVNIWQALCDEISSQHLKLVLISSELFAFDIQHIEKLKTIKNSLSDYQINIVVLLRDVVDFTKSLYGQIIRTGTENYSYQEFLIDWWHLLDWKKLIQPWQNIFGTERVNLLNYDDKDSDELFHWFIKNIFNKDVLFDSDKYPGINFSPSVRAVRLMQEINKSSLDTGVKTEIREYISNLYERYKIKKLDESYCSSEVETLLRNHCRWP